MKNILNRLLPAIALISCLLLWEFGVQWADIPAYTLPAPSVIGRTLVDNWTSLATSWWFTIKITMGALFLACLGGAECALSFAAR